MVGLLPAWIGVERQGEVLTVQSVATRYGGESLEALRELVAAEKADDPLAPVTVLVPNNIAGLFVRRHLARGITVGRPGIAGIFISTLPRLAEQIAAATLYPRTPATATVVAAAWRSVLDEAPGIFEVVADHPATIRALASAHRELRDLSDTALDAVRDTSQLHAGLIELHRAATARIADTFYDETDLLVAATELVLGRPDTLRRWGRIVLYLPQRLSRAETQLSRTFTALTDVTLLAGLTGDTKADAAVVEVFGDLGGDLEVTVTTP